MTRRSTLVRILVGLVAVSLFAVLFLRSLRSAREAPFIVEAESGSSWTLVMGSETDMLGAMVALRPPARMADVGGQAFARGGESVHYPSPASLPLVLRSEFDRAIAGALTAEDVMEIARSAGIESATFSPLCMGHRRISEPGSTRAVYFIVFDAPAFTEFRERVSERLRAAGGDASLFDPAALSPVLLVAGLDGSFSNWLPLRANPDRDCLAPIEVRTRPG